MGTEGQAPAEMSGPFYSGRWCSGRISVSKTDGAGSNPARSANFGPVVTSSPHPTPGRADAAPWVPDENSGTPLDTWLFGATRQVTTCRPTLKALNMLSLPISPRDLLEKVIRPALALLPAPMLSIEALVMLIAVAMQESNLANRWQIIDRARPEKKGPARGLWQFELGSKSAGGGVWGVYLHAASRYWLERVCAARAVPFEPRAIWLALETDDVLACCVARLLLFTDPKKLPEVGDKADAWSLYRLRTWRPGKPHPETWDYNYRTAVSTAA